LFCLVNSTYKITDGKIYSPFGNLADRAKLLIGDGEWKCRMTTTMRKNKTVDMSEVCFISVFEVAALTVINRVG